MRNLIIIATLFFSLNSMASQGGLVFICSSSDNEIKITADLQDGKNQKFTAVSVEGAKEIYPEAVRGKKKHFFFIHSNPKTLLEIKKGAQGPALVSLVTDPENNHAKIASKQPGLIITKMDAELTVPTQFINHEIVSCLETKWND